MVGLNIIKDDKDPNFTLFQNIFISYIDLIKKNGAIKYNQHQRSKFHIISKFLIIYTNLIKKMAELNIIDIKDDKDPTNFTLFQNF